MPRRRGGDRPRGLRRRAAARTRGAVLGVVLACAFATEAACQEELTLEELRQMSIDDLADLEVTSVSRQAEALSGAPAAVYVITAEEIRRYGVNSLAEALRLAPNLHVARADALGHAVSARGFNSTVSSNKLLVMIDGRTIYSPLHSAVFWDAQDVALADVERIEVVSGPGGTLWGANAVNGVINVISRSASETDGLLAQGVWGDVDRDGSVRVGLTRAGGAGVRVYGKAFERGSSINVDGTDPTDRWRRWQTGFRADWSGGSDVLTLQGDLYRSRVAGAEELQPGVRSRIDGANVLGRWSRTLGERSSLEVQAYHDRTRRDQRPVVADDVDTWDVFAQHRFALGPHALVWGTGYRVVDDRFANVGRFVMAQEESRRTLFSLFLQDEVPLTDLVSLTVGMKLEEHTYTGLEYMPNVRLAVRPSERSLWWAAVSRAVRTPSRIDRELELPGLLVSSPEFASETLIAYEAGYRGQPLEQVTTSVSAFVNRYDELRTVELQPGGAFPAFLSNGLGGTTYGVEIHGHVGLRPWWRLSGGFTAVRKNLELDPGVTDASDLGAAGNDPSFHFVVRSLMAPLPGLEVDVGLRGVDELDSPPVPGYTTLDARVGWTVLEGAEIVAAGFNLLDRRHPELGDEADRHEIPRSVSIGVRLTY